MEKAHSDVAEAKTNAKSLNGAKRNFLLECNFNYFCSFMRSIRRTIPTKILAFSKWSRKNYAIFASLKKVIKIAHLSVDLCLSSSLKNQSAISLLNKELNNILVNNSEEDELITEEQLQKFVLVYVNTNANEISPCKNILGFITKPVARKYW